MGAGEGVDAVDVHGAGATDAFAARTTEGKGGVYDVFDADDEVEDHGAAGGLVYFEGVDARRGGGGGVGGPAVDVDCAGAGRGFVAVRFTSEHARIGG